MSKRTPLSGVAPALVTFLQMQILRRPRSCVHVLPEYQEKQEFKGQRRPPGCRNCDRDHYNPECVQGKLLIYEWLCLHKLQCASRDLT